MKTFIVSIRGSFLFLLALLAIAVAASLLVGRYPLTDDLAGMVVREIRLPRVLLVMLCGMSLALAGAAMQGVFRNPLVGPELCGASAGASLGGVLAISLGAGAATTTVLAFVLAFAALACAFGLARLTKTAGMLALVLAGIIVSTFFGALVGLAQTFADPYTQLPAMVYWLLGSFADANYAKVGLLTVVFVIAGGGLLLLRWRLNLLSLDDHDAKVLGTPVTRLRWAVIALVAVLVAGQVSVSGGIAWVGLVVPHLARRLVGAGHSHLLPAAALLGGVFLLLVDDCVRGLSDQELPIGLLTAVIGAPVFAWVFWRTQQR